MAHPRIIRALELIHRLKTDFYVPSREGRGVVDQAQDELLRHIAEQKKADRLEEVPR